MMTKRLIFYLLFANALEYYSFLLFAHLGEIIASSFFPALPIKQTHLLGLLLFGLSFVTRPIGGIVFGIFSDTVSRKKSLMLAVQWSAIATFGLAILPSYSTLGLFSGCCCIILRLLQGVALGGEYTNAGTYLMECCHRCKGFVSGLLGASGSVGSLCGLGVSFLCIQPGAPAWLWRAAFLLGSVGSFVSYHLLESLPDHSSVSIKITAPLFQRSFIVFLLGGLVSVTVWIPMVYNNFYITKILLYDSTQGMHATFIALFYYIILTPLFGFVSDYKNPYVFVTISAFALIPFGIIGSSLLNYGLFLSAQFVFACSGAMIGGPVHKIINTLFAAQHRSTFVGGLFCAGLAFGGLMPFIMGQMAFSPSYSSLSAWFLGIGGLVSGLILLQFHKHVKNLMSQETLCLSSLKTFDGKPRKADELANKADRVSS